MKNFLYLIVFVFLFVFTKSEIRFVFQIFRHGARGPILANSNNKDIYGEQWTALGELTSIGMRQHYLLGRRNYDKYKQFLSYDYKQNEIYAISSDFNRTIMSAQSHLQGMYPPGTGSKLIDTKNMATPPVNYDFSELQKELGDNALPNQLSVFPIHIFQNSNKENNLFNYKVCSKTGEIINLRKRNSSILQRLSEFKKTWGPKLSDALNVTSIDDYDYDQIHYLCDTFVSDYVDGRNLTALIQVGVDLDIFFKSVLKMLYSDVLEVYAGDEELAVVVKTSFFRSLDEWMKNRISLDIQGKGYSGYDSSKMIIYSGHDRDLADIQTFLNAAFGLKLKIYPSFASSLIVELHRKEDIPDFSKATAQDYSVEISFNDEKIYNSTFSDFHSLLVKKLYSDQEIAKFCNWSDENTSDSGINYFMVATIVLSIVAIVEFIVIYYQFKKAGKPIYNQI